MADPWERIAAWCTEHAPQTAAAIRPPAPTEDQLEDPDGAAVDLPAAGGGWTSPPGTDLEVRTSTTASGTRLRYRRAGAGG